MRDHIRRLAQPATARFQTGCNALPEPLTRAAASSDRVLEPNAAPGPHRVPSKLDPVLTPCSVANEQQNENEGSWQGFSAIGETGFEPATARPPAGAIQVYPVRFGALQRSELL